VDSVPEAPTGSEARTSSAPTTEDPPASGKTAAEYAATRLAATNRGLAQTGEPRFTIQLTLAADDQEELRRYLSHLGNFIESEEVFVYRTRVRDKSYFGVVYGNFATRRAAQAALNSLPEAVRSDRPYVRSTSGIIRQEAG
jgi:septal ring-binding cell division protein DamX